MAENIFVEGYLLEDGITEDAAKLQLRTFLDCNERLAMTIYPGTPENQADVADLQRRLHKSNETDKAAGAEVIYKRAVAKQSGETLGVARWVFWPKGAVGESKRYVASPVSWVSASDPETLRYTQWVFDEFFQIRARHVQGPHAMLELLYVSSNARRLGLGQKLVELGTARADELDIPCFVEASLMGQPLYAKCGFDLVEEIDVSAPEALQNPAKGQTGIKTTVMKRPIGTRGTF